MIGLGKRSAPTFFLVYTATVNNVVLNLVLGMHGVTVQLMVMKVSRARR